MNRKKAKKLFKKYVKNECSAHEVELLHRFLDSFQDVEEIWSEFNYSDELKEEIWQKINSEINDGPPKKKYGFRSFLKYAAVIACILGLAYLLQDTGQNEPIIYKGDDNIILRTGDNTAREIVAGEEHVIHGARGAVIASQKQNRIIYGDKTQHDALVYNELEVPKGKTFELILSDGTLVHLNSDTWLKFPVGFVKGQERKVFLKGEAYFEVAKDAKNEFIVTSNSMDVKVLGTHFNVSSYENESAFAVLVEGSVAVERRPGVNERKVSKIIAPGQKAGVIGDSIVVDEVDVANYLGWRSGNLVFHNEPFKNIIEKIERKYNVTIDNDYHELEATKFRGTFENESIEDLLKTFKESAGFNYEIIDKRIVIKK